MLGMSCHFGWIEKGNRILLAECRVSTKAGGLSCFGLYGLKLRPITPQPPKRFGFNGPKRFAEKALRHRTPHLAYPQRCWQSEVDLKL